MPVTTSALALARPRLVRRPERSPIRLGVSAGIAEHLGVPLLWVRVAFVAGAVLGMGVLVYFAAFMVMPTAGGAAPLTRFRAIDWLDAVAYGAIAIGIGEFSRQVFRSVPWWAGLSMGSLVAGAVVLMVLARRHGGSPIPGTTGEVIDVLRSRPGTIARLIGGGLLVVGGAAALLATSRSWAAMRLGAFGLVIAFVGVAVALGPWLWRLGNDLVDERRARLRNEERAEMAAHLHDSVLQTLAMVQRRAEDPNEVVRLARRQERELRDWLLAGGPVATVADHETVGPALAALVAELESEHGVPIELVQVRDCPVSDAIRVLLSATREAIVNAQRHSGAAVVSVYCEIEPDAVVVYVRDRGRGFDRAAVSADRRGVRESIEGRIERHGGTAEVRSQRGEGTEVMVRVERARP